MPKDLVDHIDVDLSVLKNAEDNIKVSDIIVPKTITILTPANEVVVLAGKQKVEVEQETIEEVNSEEETTEEK
jgi:hypothetical protein